jgi:hypothetical protein
LITRQSGLLTGSFGLQAVDTRHSSLENHVT